ncbi:GNAT superfamily N-acetyltransferase [Kitasatospora sp. GAS204A]|uniref:hypothetical protein n=1 Tax=Kitasatospora sp. GAS204B TaxID=3035283 RepID=UPI00247507D4|nr:hypothetical protein [Kitasatospora sp. GAS204B]MDH6119853.1 GNAT superfamily N-acetyltransferase [Kitasatospora sp. GAS204B]
MLLIDRCCGRAQGQQLGQDGGGLGVAVLVDQDQAGLGVGSQQLGELLDLTAAAGGLLQQHTGARIAFQ